MTSQLPPPSSLVGLRLDGGWELKSLVPPGKTGGNFSLGYVAVRGDGTEGFVKVLNYERAARHADPPGEFQRLVNAHVFERDLVDRCGAKGLSHVVRGYAHGSLTVPPMPLPVMYIIFEMAYGDVRKAFGFAAELDAAARLRMAHNAANGVRQLHAMDVAHQDVKPSNLLVFDFLERDLGLSKIADLGRASDRDERAAHDNQRVAGDPAYAPPEQLYGEVRASFEERRLACDLFQLGSLIAFLVSDLSINTRLTQHLDPHHLFENWGRTVLPTCCRTS